MAWPVSWGGLDVFGFLVMILRLTWYFHWLCSETNRPLVTEHKLVAEKSVSAQRNSPTNVPCAISPTIAKEALDHIVSYVCVTRVHTWIHCKKKCILSVLTLSWKKDETNTKSSRPLVWRCVLLDLFGRRSSMEGTVYLFLVFWHDQATLEGLL